MKYIISNSLRFIEIAGKEVEFENGTMTSVRPFTVSKSCVTVDLFGRFKEETGYLTLSEQLGGKSYRSNELIEHFSEEERLAQPAFCMSFRDAISFCDWAGVRLPSESEWLAASLVDYHVYDTARKHFPPWCGPGGRLPSPLPDNAIELAQHELTSDTIGGGTVVVRGGPRYYRITGWRGHVNINRIFFGPGEWDLLNSFRVCTRGTGEIRGGHS